MCGSDAPQDLKDTLAPLDMAGMGGVAEARGFTALCSIKAALAVLADTAPPPPVTQLL